MELNSIMWGFVDLFTLFLCKREVRTNANKPGLFSVLLLSTTALDTTVSSIFTAFSLSPLFGVDALFGKYRIYLGIDITILRLHQVMKTLA